MRTRVLLAMLAAMACACGRVADDGGSSSAEDAVADAAPETTADDAERWTDLGPLLDCDGGDAGFFLAIEDGAIARVFRHGCDDAGIEPPRAARFACSPTDSEKRCLEVAACEGSESFQFVGSVWAPPDAEPDTKEWPGGVRIVVDAAGIPAPYRDAYYGGGTLRATSGELALDAAPGGVGGDLVFNLTRGDSGTDAWVGRYSAKFCVAFPVP